MKGTSKTVWVVVAYRWGERDNHSYTLGVFTKKAQAIKCAEGHTEYRGVNMVVPWSNAFLMRIKKKPTITQPKSLNQKAACNENRN